MCSHIYPTHVLLRNVGNAETMHSLLSRALVTLFPTPLSMHQHARGSACAFNPAKQRYMLQVAQSDGQHACIKLCVMSGGMSGSGGSSSESWWLNFAHRDGGVTTQARSLFLHTYAALCLHKELAPYVDASAVHPRFKSYTGEPHMSPVHARHIVDSRHMMPPPVTAFLLSRSPPHDAVETAVSAITHCVYPYLYSITKICGALSLLLHIVSSLKRDQRLDVNRIAGVTTNVRACVLTSEHSVRFFYAYALASLQTLESAEIDSVIESGVLGVLKQAASTVCKGCSVQGWSTTAVQPVQNGDGNGTDADAYTFACIVCGNANSNARTT